MMPSQYPSEWTMIGNTQSRRWTIMGTVFEVCHFPAHSKQTRCRLCFFKMLNFRLYATSHNFIVVVTHRLLLVYPCPEHARNICRIAKQPTINRSIL